MVMPDSMCIRSPNLKKGKVKCKEPTEAVLLKTLEKRLHDALVAEEEAWEKQFDSRCKNWKT